MIDQAVEALGDGRPVVLPTDTVYGLCVEPYHEAATRELYRMKQRPAEQPTALLARDVDFLLELVPELRGRTGTLVRALLPGPFTLVVANPAERFRWITGSTPDRIGVRVPQLPGPGAEVVERVGAVVASSANLRGGPEPTRLEDVPVEIRAGAAAVLDGGELSGKPSTVLDLTGPEPSVIREGAVPGGEAIERALAAAGG
ncbi:MAG TPA: L-threonylcarbamoyladenylate synthase [Gaiellaceae bacterium]|nr:L-threonylcarbamoyladenylate synthase [Gaiellaceae bacterium]